MKSVRSVTVVVRPKEPLDPSAYEGKPLSRRELAERHGADAADITRVAAYAAEHHLTVSDVHAGARIVVLTGTAANLARAFGAGDDDVPPELRGIVTAIIGVDGRASARPHSQHGEKTARGFDAPALATLYDFPKQLTGKGECIAIIELGGGFLMSDMKAYFDELGLKVPKIVSIGVDGGGNHPGHDIDSDKEVALDIQVAGAIANDATLAVYFTQPPNNCFFDAVKRAIHDDVHKPTVLSISWGGPENSWTSATMTEFDRAFQEAAALGITVLASSGDVGSAGMPNPPNREPHAEFPCTSPYALACGGTRLVAVRTTIESETAWNNGPHGRGAGGGGVSDVFGRPHWQASSHVPKSPAGSTGRGVPDVSANGDPNTGYNVIVGGAKTVIGGTSAVAPLYAGLIARINEARKGAGGPPAGWINVRLYSAANACRDVTKGNNDYYGNLGVYEAKAGWDACTGLGSAHGEQWLALLRR